MKLIKSSNTNPPVTKRVLIESTIIVFIMVASLALRELYSNNTIINALFGGLNILVFWGISAFLFWKIESIFFGKEESEDNNKINIRRSGIFYCIATIVAASVIFFGSIHFFNARSLVAFWIILIFVLLLFNIIFDWIYKAKKVRGSGPKNQQN